MPSTGTGTNRQQISYSIQEIAEKFICRQLATGRSPRTLHVYKRILADLRAFLLEKLTSDDIRLITRSLVKEYVERIWSFTFGQEEKRAWLARVQIFFAWATAEALILADPSAAIQMRAAKKRKHPVYFTQTEVARILDAVSTKTPAGLRDRAILELLYSSGLRSGEICRLTLADINFADGTARVLMSKGKKDRMVPVGKVALTWIDSYVKEVHGLRLSGPLFYHLPDGRPLEDWYLRQIVSRYRAKAHLKKHVHPRNFRHSFAIHLLENGASIRHIQAMMGHADLRTTEKYTRIVPEELKRVHQRAHPSEHRGEKFPPAEPVVFADRKKGVPCKRATKKAEQRS